MGARSDVDKLPDTGVLSPRNGDVYAGVSGLHDSNCCLEEESDNCSDDTLNTMNWVDLWVGNSFVGGDALISNCSLSSYYMPSPFELPERSSQRHVGTSIFSSKSDSYKFEKGVGLANLGNTCFLNAVLQCFLHTTPLLQSILLDTHTIISQCSEDSFCVLCALRKLMELSLSSSIDIVQPWIMVENLSYFSMSFNIFQQEDAHEFLQCFLDRLESCQDAKQRICQDSERNNFVRHVFGGCLISKLKCCECDHCSCTYEPSVDLSLEIDDADNLLTALQSFTKVEKIEDPENMYTCENCKNQVPIEKHFSFYQAPLVAAFQLKRFKNNGGFVEKIDRHVAFPLELDMKPFTSGGKTNYDELKYKLYAVVVHVGSSSISGHYYCCIRLAPDVWCKYDDSEVHQVHEDFVLSQEAYILLYAKVSTPWFSTFVETQKLCMKTNILNTSPTSVLDTFSCKSYSYDATQASSSTGSKWIEVEDDQNKNGSLISDVSTSACLDFSSLEYQNGVPPCSPKKFSISQEISAPEKYQTFDYQTPNSQCLEICSEDPADIFSIQCNHVGSRNDIEGKRQLHEDVDNLEATLVYSLIEKSTPDSRKSKYEVPMRRKKRRKFQSLKKLNKKISTRRSPSMRHFRWS